jgi:hypothetical protein
MAVQTKTADGANQFTDQLTMPPENIMDVSITLSSEFVPPEGDYPSYQGENPSLKRVSKLAKSKSWEWWLVNNVEYIQPLEDGHSSIAPQGMVAVSLQSFADHLSQNLRQSEYWDDA